jgi:hypothetical protein
VAPRLASNTNGLAVELHPKEMRDEKEDTIDYDFCWEMYVCNIITIIIIIVT